MKRRIKRGGKTNELTLNVRQFHMDSAATFTGTVMALQKNMKVLNEFKIKVEHVLMLVKTMHVLQRLEAWQMWEQASAIFKEIIVNNEAGKRDITLTVPTQDGTQDNDSQECTTVVKPKVMKVIKTLRKVAVQHHNQKHVAIVSEGLVFKKGLVLKKIAKKDIREPTEGPPKTYEQLSLPEMSYKSPTRKSERKVTPSKFHSSIVKLLQRKDVEVHDAGVSAEKFVMQGKTCKEKPCKNTATVAAPVQKTSPQILSIKRLDKTEPEKSGVTWSIDAGDGLPVEQTIQSQSANCSSETADPRPMSPPHSPESVKDEGCEDQDVQENRTALMESDPDYLPPDEAEVAAMEVKSTHEPASSSIHHNIEHTTEMTTSPSASHAAVPRSDHDHAYNSTAQADDESRPTVSREHVHRKRKPAERKGQSCPICGHIFKYRSNLNVHMRSHSGLRPFLCSVCGKGFVTKTNMRRHMMTHTGEKPFKCTYCEKPFSEKRSMQAHMRTHTGERPFPCPECDQAFTQLATLNQHRHLHTGWQGYLCEICGKSFRQKSACRSHAKRHTGQKDWQCATCNKSFYTKGEVQRHELGHTGARPFLCQYCPMTFTRLQYLIKHMPSHTGEKPQYCEVCNKRFRDEASFVRHQRRHSYRQFEQGRVLKLPRDTVVHPSDPRVQERMQEVLPSHGEEVNYAVASSEEQQVLDAVNSIQEAELMVEGGVAMETIAGDVPQGVVEMPALETVAMEMTGLDVPAMLLQDMPETPLLDMVTVEVTQDPEVRPSTEKELEIHVPH